MRSNSQERIIYLLRHGSVCQAGSERRYIGQVDVPLSGEGMRQARLLHLAFSGKDISVAFCSDLIRSMDTATILCQGITEHLMVRRDLREISMGEWEGKTMREVAKTQPEEYTKRGKDIAHYRIPGAESFAECKDRVVAAFSEITATVEGNILIVAHAGVNRLLLGHLLGMPIENIFRISQDYGCVNIVTGGRGTYRVKLLNGFCRLEGSGAGSETLSRSFM